METPAGEKKAAVEEPKKAPQDGKTAKPAKDKKKGGCLKGCLIFFVVLLLAAGAIVANMLGLPRKWGLTKSRAEKVFDVASPDYTAAADLKAEVGKAGVPTKGMDVIVLPKKDGTGSAAYVVMDASKGFTFNASKSGDPFLNTLASMAKSEAVKKNGVQDVAFEYRDEKGRTIITIGAPIQAAADFADGKITRQQFMAKVGGKLDIPNVIAAEKELLK